MDHGDTFEDPRAVLKRHGLKPKRSWGQNFLVSAHAVQTIAAACVGEHPHRVIEIGAGLGTLTQGLLARGATVIAVERDPVMCDVLHAEFSDHPRFTLCRANAATFDYAAHLGEEPGIIAGNLPYQLTGQLLRRVTEPELCRRRAVLTVQLEVAQRMVAGPGTKARGALSVMLQARFAAQIIKKLAPGAFFPPPQVESAVVTLVPHTNSPLVGVDSRKFDQLVKAAFANRRKTLKNSFSAGGLGSAGFILRLCDAAGIDPTIRAERLNNEAFVTLTRCAADLAGAGEE